MHKTVAIIGAGMAGARCAERLAAAGLQCVVFDKGRGPGGRMSARRTGTGHRFDHGVPWLQANTAGFRSAIDRAIEANVIHLGEHGYIGVNGMSAFCKHLLREVDVRCSTRVTSARHDAGWMLADESGVTHGPFDGVVIAIPPSQAAEIIQGVAPKAASRLLGVRMLPRWSAMLGFDGFLSSPQSVIQLHDAQVYRSSTNVVGDGWIVQASQVWSIEHLERTADAVLVDLAAMARDAIGADWKPPIFSAAHRWRYAFVDEPTGEPFIEASADGLWVCGDWCLGRTVQDAWTSGDAVAARVEDSVARPNAD